MHSSDFQELLSLYEAERYDDALKKLSMMEHEMRGSAPLQVIKGRLIQLADCADYSLHDAKLAFLKAIDLDRYCVEAMLELGWLEFNVFGRSREALDYFEMAKNVATEFSGRATDAMSRVNSDASSD